LNTIHEGGFVPWFGTQLVNGNSLIGARRQVYRVENLTTTSKGLRWFELAPERIPVGTARADKNYQMHRKQIYHFLLGDPGMCNYSDKVIKSLEPDNIKTMKAWNKKFNAPYDQNDVGTLLRLSSIVDELWEAQVSLRKEVEQKTQDHLSVFGHQDDAEDSHTTIRQKDKILSELYKSEHMRNAGPYARLKFAMDYWCALWFWPIDKADLLPSRSEFFFDMSLILEGTIASINVDKYTMAGQMSLFPTEMEQMAVDIVASYGLNYQRSVVDIPALRKNNPRLDLAYRIAEQNKFMHWELEFADLFADKGGFDLVIGNPPWILMLWNEQDVLADSNPLFAIRSMSAAETAQKRMEALQSNETYSIYFNEYEQMASSQSYMCAAQNYYCLLGMKTNLFKCFLPQAWDFSRENGVSAFVHPDGVYDDPKGTALRKVLYPRLRKHFQFTNELKLFAEVDHHMGFSLNVYCNSPSTRFDSISNLYDPSTIEDCYDKSVRGNVPGIKDDLGRWNTQGHPKRIVQVGKRELSLFAKLFDDSDDWESARLPSLHTQVFLDALERFAIQSNTIASIPERDLAYAVMFFEAADSKTGIIKRDVHFPDEASDTIISGPHIGVANPRFKTSRAICRLNSDYDSIDLMNIRQDYMARCNYRRACNQIEYEQHIIDLPWGGKYHSTYRIGMRKMLNLSGERTLVAAIIPPGVCHIDGIYSMTFKKGLVSMAGCMASIPYDFYIKVTGKANGCYNVFSAFPCFEETNFAPSIEVRALLLNAITEEYAALWNSTFNQKYCEDGWAKQDSRLNDRRYKDLSIKWDSSFPLRSDFERREALVELDVLVSMALGMSLDQLRTAYRIQFPVLQSYEADTWYDANGRIVFTNNRSLTNVGFSRSEWEKSVKGAPAGKKYYRTITDDTMPGGSVERTIEYVAPFDRCNREQDYETAWKFFEEKYGKK